MLDLMTAQMLAEQRTRQLWAGPAGDRRHERGLARPVRRSTRDRLAAWWAARPSRWAPAAVPAN
jgi:hypothetical protein